MTTPIKTTHGGIEITYIEGENKWQFELRGRERRVDSLTKAREAIDKPEPQEKPEFKRIKCYLSPRYGGGFSTVEVTSITDWLVLDTQEKEILVKKNALRAKLKKLEL